MAPTLGGGTQDTDVNNGFTKESLQKIFGEEMGGCQGDPDPLMFNPLMFLTLTLK